MAEKGVKSEAAKREEELLRWWKEHAIFEKSLAQDAPKGEFVFFEGPPTANGRPGIHHIESRAFKDAVPRYKTMRGYRVARRAGWDTHGLPVELEVEKQLGFSGKPDIEKYGIAAFNEKCRASVLTYIDEWSRFTERIGYWVDQTKAYFTYDAPYMESLFAIVKEIADDGRLYKDYKVLPWCSRCGTALSSHELAQGYEEVKDLSVTVKFELEDEPGTYLLAWTTTPWTLPGNVALAVGKGIAYGVYEKDGEQVIVAVNRAEALGLSEPKKTISGEELLGKKYKPLFGFLPALANETEKPKFEKAYQVYAADFVTTEEGTGIVHTAVMYGADDFELGTSIGLPKVHAVGADGKFISGTGYLEGRFVKEQDDNGKPTLAVEIIDDLKSRGLYFSQENYKHTYPFCWRCKTPLIYYARDSWYIRMTDLRETLLAENKKISWEPEHIRDGRMGEWLSGAKDWAISRERYWGTPLPIWENEDGAERLVVGSVEELKARTKKSGNKYIALRHGESENNCKSILSSAREGNPLTPKGKEEVLQAANQLKEKKPTRIYASPLLRTRETAEIVADILGLSKDAIVYDDRLRELSFGAFEDKPLQDWLASRENASFTDARDGAESYQEAKQRFGAVLEELEKNHVNETILIVTHGIGLESLSVASRFLSQNESKELIWSTRYATGEVLELPFVPLPHNDRFELDLHRPYIDDVVLLSDSGTEMRRVKEVMDVWFDSGAMPFAQEHYPFERKEWVDGPGYPADFISEAIDQTRGWFYTLLAIGVLKKRGTPYKNVICLGHLLDDKGRKMSKSKGNVVNPWEAMDEWGVDTLRFWMYSVNQSGDSKSFDTKTVKESARTLSWLENSLKFYELFKEGSEEKEEQVLDRWMRARTNETVVIATSALDTYELYDATRAISKLFEDLSQWYVRRIRDRAREGDRAALATLQETLKTSALLLAPFSPFLAEEIWQKTRSETDVESVHLATWPEGGKTDTALIEDMSRLRGEASELLKMRQQANIVVRQPLSGATVSGSYTDELIELLKEEVNVKGITVAETVSLATELTPELVAEGDERAFMRAVAEARKTLGLSPKDKIEIVRGDGPYEAELSTGIEKFALKTNAS